MNVTLSHHCSDKCYREECVDNQRVKSDRFVKDLMETCNELARRLKIETEKSAGLKKEINLIYSALRGDVTGRDRIRKHSTENRELEV